MGSSIKTLPHKDLTQRGQDALPRYRRRRHKVYVFAAYCRPLKCWLVIGETWGFMDSGDFHELYTPSNQEAVNAVAMRRSLNGV